MACHGRSISGFAGTSKGTSLPMPALAGSPNFTTPESRGRQAEAAQVRDARLQAWWRYKARFQPDFEGFSRRTAVRSMADMQTILGS
jgi:hypothetical protein